MARSRNQQSVFIKCGLTAVLLGAIASPSNAAIDTLQTVVNRVMATGQATGISLSAFGYNPIDDSILVAGFGASGALRRISNVGGAQTAETVLTATELRLYYQGSETDTDLFVSSPSQSGILFNPLAIGTGESAIAPYSRAFFADLAITRLDRDSPDPDVPLPAESKRFYSYKFDPLPTGGDGRDVLTTLATLADMQAVAAVGPDVGSNQGRQFAWSGDGQTIYFVDAGAATSMGGLWTLDPVNGDVQRLFAESGNFSEPAVLSQGGVDTIYIAGAATGNDGGIDKITYDGTTLGARSAALTVSDFRTFLDAPSTHTPDVGSIASDAEGNLYFTNESTSPERRGMFKLDQEGRLSKVVSYAERDIVFTGALTSPAPNSSSLRMQPRQVNHATAGEITQILYSEPTTVSVVAGAYVFEVGDFDRNGAAGETADMALFSAALKTRGTALTDQDHYKFDLNANSVVDWKDVKILQQFVDIPNGDANFDGVLNLVDLDVVGLNYYTTSPTANKTWATGDFASVDPLYAANAVDANIVNLVDLQLFADTWLNVLEQPITESELTSRGYGGQFLTDVLDVFGFNTGLAGDFDLSGLVDGADFLLWQRQFGTTVDAGTGADADGNGTIDAADLAVWKENFGAGSIPEVVAAAVPEPSTLLLGTLAVAGVAGLRRRQSVR